MSNDFEGSHKATYQRASIVARKPAGASVGLGRSVLATILLAAVAVTGCAGKSSRPVAKPAPPTPPASWVYTPQTMQRVPVERPDAIDARRPADLAVVVRGVKVADLDEVDGFYQREKNQIDKMYGTNAELGAMGLAMGGYPGAQVIAGVLFIAPLTFTLDMMLKNTVTTINDTLKDVDMIAETKRALIARGVPVTAPDPDVVQATLVINKYGLIGKNGAIRGMGSEACLIVAADLVIAEGGREVFRDAIYINTFRRSADAPPPSCRSVQDFAEKDGRPLRNAARTYSQVLAAITVQRIKEIPWKR